MVVLQGVEPGHQRVQGHAHLGHAPLPGHGFGEVLHRPERGDQAGVSPRHCSAGMVLGIGRLRLTSPQVSFLVKKIYLNKYRRI